MKTIFNTFFLSTCIFIFTLNGVFAQNVDPNFKPVIKGVPYVSTIRVLPDGKLFIGGNVSSAGSTPTKAVIKLNPDGTIDDSFHPPFYLISPGQISAIEVDNDNKIVVGAVQQKLDGKSYIVRLNSDGEFDNTFSNNCSLEGISRIKALSNGKYLVSSGTFRNSYGFNRLNSDGSVDESFTAYSEEKFRYTGAFEVLANDKILCAVYNESPKGFAVGKIIRLNSNGSLDNTFEIGSCAAPEEGQSFINDIKVLPDGRIYLAGEFSYFKGKEASGVIRINSNGTLDDSFISPSPIRSIINFGLNRIFSIQLCEKGKLLLTGMGTTNGNIFNIVARLNYDGSIDNSFNVAAFSLLNSTNQFARLALGNNRTYIIGDHIKNNNDVCMGIAAIDTSGLLIKEFLPDLGGNPIVSSVYQQKNGKIIIGGVFSKVGEAYTNNIVRFNKDGSVDTTFAKNIGTGADLEVRTIACQSDSSILIGGDVNFFNDTYTGLLVRLKPDGTLDKDFKAQISQKFIGVGLNKILVDSLDRIIVGGVFDWVNGETRAGFAVFNPDGSLSDANVSGQILPNWQYWIRDMGYQSNGKLIIAGDIINDPNTGFIMRLNKDWSVDPNFTNSLSNVYARSMDILDNDSIVIGTMGWNDDSRIIQLDENGNLIDNTKIFFREANEGDPMINCIVHSGKDQLIAGGRFSSVNASEKPALIKVSLNGDVDEFFKYDVNGRIIRFFQEDSTHLFVAGNFNRIGNDYDLFCIARIDINFPQNPTNLQNNPPAKMSSKGSAISLTWLDQSDNETGFSVERSIDNVNFSSIKRVGSNIHSFNDESVVPNSKYYYRVKAFNVNGGSSYTNTTEGISTATSIVDDNETNSKIVLTPNPGNGNISLLFKDSDINKLEVNIYDLVGNCIYQFKTLEPKNQISLSISKEPAGVYFIKINTNGRTPVTFKYIKQ